MIWTKKHATQPEISLVYEFLNDQAPIERISPFKKDSFQTFRVKFYGVIKVSGLSSQLKHLHIDFTWNDNPNWVEFQNLKSRLKGVEIATQKIFEVTLKHPLLDFPSEIEVGPISRFLRGRHHNSQIVAQTLERNRIEE